MSTPMDRQALPEGSNSTIATGPTPDPVKVRAAQTVAATSKMRAAQAVTAYNRAKAEAARQMGRYRAKGATAAQQGAATRARNAALAEMERQTGVRNAALKAQAGAQKSYYELSGQFDKLLTGSNRDAYAALQSLFTSYGLGSLAGKIYDYIKQGNGADTISLLLQDTKEYKQRFAANEARAKAGLPVLSPGDYLATEESYRQILQDTGMPKGMYDNPADFQKWIAGDVSPTELKSRVDTASAMVTQFNPSAVQALDQLYGIDSSHLLAYAFDRNIAVPVLQKQAAAAQIGGEALMRGLSVDRTRMENYVTEGLSQSQAAAGFQQVAEELPILEAISKRWGVSWDQGQEEASVFGTSAQATQKKKTLASQERGLFSGASGGAQAGLSPGYRQT